MTGPDPLIVNKAWYDGLPADLQQVFDEVAVEALAMSDKRYRDAEASVIYDLAEFMEIYTLTPVALAEFQEKVQPVYQQMIDAGHFTADDIEAARVAAQSCG